LPMPGGGVLPPPPPPPFDPTTGAAAPALAAPAAASPPPAQAAGVPAATVQPVMPDVVPIQPAAPPPEQGYLGANPAMQDQVYTQNVDAAASNDPGAFRLPG